MGAAPVRAEHRGRPRAAGWIAGALLLAFASRAALGAAEPAPAPDRLPPAVEYQIKASFIYTVAKFVDWSPSVFPPPGTPLTFGIVGSDAVSEAIASELHGKKVHDRDLIVRRLPSLDHAKGCQIVYIADASGMSLPGLLEQLDSAGVLTVGESQDFAAQGGVLSLRMQDTLVQFDVNMVAAQRAGLTISSKILRLGRVLETVRPASEPRP